MAYKDKNVMYIKLPDRMGWMVTCSDLVTLLLTFFVMIIAMSSMDSKVLKDSFGFFSAVTGPLEFSREHEVKVAEQEIVPVTETLLMNAFTVKVSVLSVDDAITLLKVALTSVDPALVVSM